MYEERPNQILKDSAQVEEALEEASKYSCNICN
jgi:hypothetical protein